jgi:hypothetical protein
MLPAGKKAAFSIRVSRIFEACGDMQRMNEARPTSMASACGLSSA